MTVAQLMAELSKHPPDERVEVRSYIRDREANWEQGDVDAVRNDGSCVVIESV